MNCSRPTNGFSRIALASLWLIALLVSHNAGAEAAFQKWIQDFYPQAAKAGVSKHTYDSVFSGIDSPDPAVLKAARYQPEFVAQIWDYMDARITEDAVAKGRTLAREYKKWLDLIEARYGVERHILLAIWSMESSYGAALQRVSVLRSVARSLATLAYADPKRRKFAREQLIAALRIVQNGDIDAADLRGSWAGAMGHTQFIPTSYLTWAVDIDGDGKRNIWTSPPDALASSAHLLYKNGWQTGKTWGYEVRLPGGFDYKLANDEGITLRQWSAMGVKRVAGTPFPRPDDKAVLKLPGGFRGAAFLMLKNFYVLKRYNNADKYALAVGHLADRLRGYGPLVQSWPRGYKPLKEGERREVQIRLAKQGFYDGEIDGNIGSVSRTAIRAYQEKNGLVPDGFASKSLLDQMQVIP
jgi:membrane-bound lytic murein transglycosylase B